MKASPRERGVPLLVGLALLLAQPGSALGQDTGSTHNAVKGAWVVSYHDLHAGLVSGRAFLDPDAATASIDLTHPKTGRTTVLTADDVSVDGSRLTLTWGPSKTHTARTFRPFGENLPTPGNSVIMSLGEAAHEVSLSEAAVTDGRVAIDLTYFPESDMLAGDWRQPIDAVSGKAGRQDGRSGFFRYGSNQEGGADLTGIEAWRRPQPVIKHTFAIKDQFATLFDGAAAYAYPATEHAAQGYSSTTRMIFVTGRELPLRRGEGIEIESLDDDVSYFVYALQENYDRQASLTEHSQADTFWRDEAHKRIDQIAAGDPALARDPSDDFMVIEATLKPGVKPGYKALTINGVRTAWLLRFGDHKATIGFARDLTADLRNDVKPGSALVPAETELTDLVYQQGQVHLEIRTESTVPVDEFSILIAKNGEPLMFGSERAVIARRASTDANVYRTAPITLVGKGMATTYPPTVDLIEVARGDKLQATITSAPILNLRSTFAQAEVLSNPTQSLAAIEGPSAPVGLLWREAVIEAAKCADIEGIRSMDASALARLEADSYTDLVVSTIWNDVESVLGTRISIGVHAGAILMRPVFIAQMRAALAVYAKDYDDDQIASLRRSMRTSVGRGHPLEAMSVAAPDGSPIPFATTFYDAHLQERYGLIAGDLAAYQINAMREARAKLAVAIKASLDKAIETDACDVRAMLYLTGFGWENVRQRTHAGLMKLKTVSETFRNAAGATLTSPRSYWVADRQARAHVDNVALFAQRLREQEKLSDDEWDNFFITVSLLTLPIGIGAEFLAIEGVVASAAILDASDFVVNVYQELSKQRAESVELQFARGASAVIGTARFDKAVADDSSGVVSYFKVVLSAAQLANAAQSLTSAARLERANRRGNRIISDMYAARKRVDDIAEELTESDIADLNAVIVRARQRRAALGQNKLTPEELRALAFDRQAADGAYATSASRTIVRPDWAAPLSAEAFSRIGDMIGRSDIAALALEDVAEFNRLLMDDAALDLLRLPQTDLASLKRAVQGRQNRAPTRGREFVEQAAEINGNPEGLSFGEAQIVDLDGYRTATVDVYAGLAAEGTRYGSFTRGRLPDAEFGTGKDLLVLDSAQTFRQFPRAAGPPRDGGQVAFAAGPRWVTDVRVPLRENAPGVPFVMFSNLRTAQALGFEFADANLGGLMLKHVMSANTSGQLHWLRQAYPGRSIDELFRYTHSFQYAENTAQQLGFRISEVRVRPPSGATDIYDHVLPLDSMVEGRWFDPGNARTPQDVEAARVHFLEKYRVPGRPNVPFGYDVFLKLEAL